MVANVDVHFLEEGLRERKAQREKTQVKDFLKSKTVLFSLFMTVVVQLYWLFGQEGYRTNMTGYLILSLPLVLLGFIIWRKVRGGVG